MTGSEGWVKAAKESGVATLDAYQRACQVFLDCQRQVAEATQPGWVSSLVKAQTDFVAAVNAACVNAARRVWD